MNLRSFAVKPPLSHGPERHFADLDLTLLFLYLRQNLIIHSQTKRYTTTSRSAKGYFLLGNESIMHLLRWEINFLAARADTASREAGTCVFCIFPKCTRLQCWEQFTSHSQCLPQRSSNKSKWTRGQHSCRTELSLPFH